MNHYAPHPRNPHHRYRDRCCSAGSRIAPPLSSQQVQVRALWDDFERPDGPPGIAPSGQTWIQASAFGAFEPVQSRITNGTLTAPDSGKPETGAYTSALLSGKPVRLAASVVFAPGLSPYGAVALVANPHGTLAVRGNTDITRDSIHVVFTDAFVVLGLFQAGRFSELATVYYEAACLPDGQTAYDVGWQFDANTNTITVEMPDGTTTSRSDARLGQVIGPYITFEHYWIGDTADHTAFLSVSADVAAER